MTQPMTNPIPQEAIIIFCRKQNKSFVYSVEELKQGKEQNFSEYFESLKIGKATNEDVKNYKPIRIRIIVYSAKALLTGMAQRLDQVNHFAQTNWEWSGKNDDKFADWDALPSIHITENNNYIESLYGDKPLNEKIPRSFQIMDNSIWNYLVPKKSVPEVDENGKKVTLSFEDNFFSAIESIYRNYQKKLYSLSVAKEYADLNARLAKQAFVAGSHAEGVSPFIFHSESAIQRMIKKEFVGEDNVIKKIADQKWRILLVDDKAKQSMQNDKNDNNEYSWNCKLVVIINLFKRFIDKYANGKIIACQEYVDKKNVIRIFDEKNLELVEAKKEGVKDSDIFVMFEFAQNVEAAEKALRARTYDLVLLDYYLEKDKSGNHSYGTNLLETVCKYVSAKKSVESLLLLKPEEKKKETKRIFDTSDIKYEELRKYIDKVGHENIKLLYDTKDIKLIEKVYEEIKNEEKLGGAPCDRHFFMFISAYSSAVHDRLLAEGLNQSERYWYVNLGACPTNTPQLFLYNLIKLMEKRLDDSGILKLSSTDIYDLAYKIYLPKEQDSRGDSIRKRANALYQKVLSLQYHYRSILKDVEIPFGQNATEFDTKGSVLMTHFIQNKINLGGMLEHITQLVHITAFGTVRQWPEMWEEYIYFKAMFEKQIEKDNENIDCGTLFSNIENYILKLKSQQQ